MFAHVKFNDDCCPQTYDVSRHLTRDCTVSSLDFDQESYWHSSAHVLGAAIERQYPDSLLAHGPPTDEGFFYDFSGGVVTQADY